MEARSNQESRKEAVAVETSATTLKETISISESRNNTDYASNTGGILDQIEPFVRKRDHDPGELKSWAKRTGFVSNFSGDIGASSNKGDGNKTHDNKERNQEQDVSERRDSSLPEIKIDPVLGRTNNGETASKLDPIHGSVLESNVIRLRNGKEGTTVKYKDGERIPTVMGNGIRNEISQVKAADELKKDSDGVETDFGVNVYPDAEGLPPGDSAGSSAMRCGLRDDPGFVPLFYYGFQHYFSMIGSLVFMPLVMVPAMGGTDKDTADLICTILLVTGITTILQTFLGTRLPLVVGSSFVYLAPALVIANSKDNRNLTEHRFRHIMRELQGAIIVSSIFQSVSGLSGLMSFILRLINPVVVAPTVAAVGLGYFSYGFPQAGSCAGISIPLIFLILLFSLHLRGVSIIGQQIFRIYAVPLSVMIIWACAFFLTAGGVYDYKNCSPNIPTSNILMDSCRRHATTIQHCRTDVSTAWRTADWIRIPYPFQWGFPIFHTSTSIIMTIISFVASIDSVSTYHSTSSTIGLNPPSAGVVSRGIGLEGLCSMLAGLWGTGTGATTLTENVHTLHITKVANRRAVLLGAGVLIFTSFLGKVGAVLASMPLALAAAVLCFVWGLVIALGLSTLKSPEHVSSRNFIIVGASLFLGLSVSEYFHQHDPLMSFVLPPYLIPYSAASDGPIRSGRKEPDFALNALLSMNMVVTLFVAFLLDNTSPRSRGDRAVYVWSTPEDLASAGATYYSLPRKPTWVCACAKFL